MYKDSYKVDILFLIEHRDRELDATCAIAKILKTEYNLSVAIASLLFHSLIAAVITRPKVIVVPFTYSAGDFPISLFRAIYGDRIIYVNMNLEQILSPVNQEYKKPQDQFSKLNLKHFCWGKSFKDYLLSKGVKNNNIYITGNPATTLLKNLASREKNLLKSSLAERFQLPLDHKWLFFPMNCGWAFTSDYHIRSRISNGYNEKNAWTYKSYLNNTLNTIFNWISKVEKEIKQNKNIIILRPHPSVSVQQYKERFNEIIGYIPNYVHIIKDLTAKDWLVACDTCYTNFSTVALDAQLIGKLSYLMEPHPYPSFLLMDWYEKFTNLRTFNDFRNSLKSNFDNKIKDNFILNDYIDSNLNGIKESAKYLTEFVMESQFASYSFYGLLKGIRISLRQSIGGLLRVLIAESRFNPFNILLPGIKYDYFRQQDVARYFRSRK